MLIFFFSTLCTLVESQYFEQQVIALHIVQVYLTYGKISRASSSTLISAVDSCFVNTRLAVDSSFAGCKLHFIHIKMNSRYLLHQHLSAADSYKWKTKQIDVKGMRSETTYRNIPQQHNLHWKMKSCAPLVWIYDLMFSYKCLVAVWYYFTHLNSS